jgi:hypothetical protein
MSDETITLELLGARMLSLVVRIAERQGVRE